MAEKHSPHYDLDEVRRLVEAGKLASTNRVRRHLRTKQWRWESVADCLMTLEPKDLHKSQRHRERSGQWLDIYKPTIDGRRMYLKFTVSAVGDVLVMSFCLDGEEH